MRKFMRLNRILMLALTGFVSVLVATSAAAGTAYQWTTEDGTLAFTDDPKRIPAKYKDAATKRDLGKLKSYPRFTVAKTTTREPYGERLGARLEALRTPALPAVSAAPPSAGAAPGLRLDLGLGEGRYGNGDQLSIPIDAPGDEPVVISNHRVRMRNSIATQDVQIAKQGDRILAVTVSPRNQRKINERPIKQRDQLDPGVLFR
jgi:hypothetical protein